MAFLGYEREPRNFDPPLGGKPWRDGFPEYLDGFVTRARENFAEELAKQSMYGTKHSAADDVFHQAAALESAWRSAQRSGTSEAVGMFEVRLLSAVLVARHNIAPAMLKDKEGIHGSRPAESYLNDLRTAARILSGYTGADAEEIEERSRTQGELMEYLKGYLSTLEGQ
jgi:hypothetical protein